MVRTDVWFENVRGDGTEWVEHPIGPSTPPPDDFRPAFAFDATKARVVDMTGNGVNDIVFTDAEIPGGKVWWMENVGGEGRQWRRHEVSRPREGAPRRGAYHSLQVADFTGNGHLDIFSAEMEWVRGAAAPRWYVWENLDGRGTRWHEHVILDANLGGHEALAGDVTGNGRLDVIAGSFIPTEVHWYENPGPEALRLGQTWPQHLLVDTGDSTNEGQLMVDIDGDGRPEWVVNSWRQGVPMRIWRLVDCPPQPSGAIVKLVPSTLGETANGHGIGVGDLNGNGLTDVLVGEGWYEQPATDPWNQPWTFHRDWELQASLPMLVRDLDGDGRNDLIFGNGHNYGLFWWRNLGPGEDGKIRWKETLIDRGFSQPHSMTFADLDGDGQDELITGKRYFAHNGGDPGGHDPPCLYYYKWDSAAGNFKRFVIDEQRVGTGLQIVAEDLNGNGKVDIAVAGKSGTYLLLQE